jgi:hypothetical protein
VEIRWYKGKYKVEVILKSKGNWRVRALEAIPFPLFRYGNTFSVAISSSKPKTGIEKGDEFTTVPRLLWWCPRKRKGSIA